MICKMNRYALFFAAAFFGLLLAGCAESPPSLPEESVASTAESRSEYAAPSSLTADIEGHNCVLGVGFIGYVGSEDDEAAVRDLTSYSALADKYPFLTDCSPVLSEGAELYAFVPSNSDISVSVYPAEISEDGNYIDRREAPIYNGKPGETVVLRCNLSEIHSNVLIAAEGNSGTLEFHPMLSMENGRMVRENGCYDFSVYEQDPVEAARELLLAADEIQDALNRGMKLLSTGDIRIIEGMSCPIFALGTDSEEQFVRERLYAVSDGIIYVYSALSDSWDILSAEQPHGEG